MAEIVERGWLIAGVDLDTYRFATRDPVTELLGGFDIDIARDIARAIFGEPGHLKFRQLNLDEQLGQVENDDVDMVVGTLSTTCVRRERVRFSAVYFEASQRVLVNRGSGITGIADLGGKRVCAARSSTSLGKVLTHPAQPVPVGTPSVTECLVRLQLGEVEAVSTDDALLAGLAAQDSSTELVGPRLSQEPYAVVINQADDDLVRFVNGVLERRVDNGRWQASYERWLATLLDPLPGPPPAPPQPQYRD